MSSQHFRFRHHDSSGSSSGGGAGIPSRHPAAAGSAAAAAGRPISQSAAAAAGRPIPAAAGGDAAAAGLARDDDAARTNYNSKCFKCGCVGHWARDCAGRAQQAAPQPGLAQQAAQQFPAAARAAMPPPAARPSPSSSWTATQALPTQQSQADSNRKRALGQGSSQAPRENPDARLQMLTGTVAKVRTWIRLNLPNPVLFVVYGKLLSDVQTTTALKASAGEGRGGSSGGLKKVYIIRDFVDPVQKIRCIFYEIDRPMDAVVQGDNVRVVGKAQADGSLQAFSCRVEPPSPLMPRLIVFSERGIQLSLEAERRRQQAAADDAAAAKK